MLKWEPKLMGVLIGAFPFQRRRRIARLNITIVFEDPVTKDCDESLPYAVGSTLDVRCPCGNFVHPILGAWCTKCGSKIVELRHS